MTDPDGRAPEETTEPGADTAGPAEAAASDAADAEGLDEGAADAEDAGFDEAEEDEADFEDELGEEVGAAPAAAFPGVKTATTAGTGGAGRRFGRRSAAEPEHAQTASERAVHIDDRISKVFVLGIAAIFVLIFLNALLVGKGGLLTPVATPTPIPSATAAPSASPVASTTPAPSASPAATAAPTASASAAP